jgi:hypothetical protein
MASSPSTSPVEAQIFPGVASGSPAHLPPFVSPDALTRATEALAAPFSLPATADALATVCDATLGAFPLADRERSSMALYGMPYDERVDAVAHEGLPPGARLSAARRGLIGGVVASAAGAAALGAAGEPLLTRALVVLRNLCAGTRALPLKERALRAAEALPVLEGALQSASAESAGVAAGMLANVASLHESRLLARAVADSFEGGLWGARALLCAALARHVGDTFVVSAVSSALNNLAGVFARWGGVLHLGNGPAPDGALPPLTPAGVAARYARVEALRAAGDAARSRRLCYPTTPDWEPPGWEEDWEEEEDNDDDLDEEGRDRARAWGAGLTAPLGEAMHLHRGRLLAGDAASAAALSDAARAFLGTGHAALPAAATFQALTAALAGHRGAEMGGAVARAVLCLLNFVPPDEELGERGFPIGEQPMPAAGAQPPSNAQCGALFRGLANVLIAAPAAVGASGDVAKALAGVYRMWNDLYLEDACQDTDCGAAFNAVFAALGGGVAGALGAAARGGGFGDLLPRGFTHDELRTFEPELLGEVCAAQGLAPAGVAAALGALGLCRGVALSGFNAAACVVCGGAGARDGGGDPLLRCDGTCAHVAAAHASCANVPGTPAQWRAGNWLTSSWFCEECARGGVAPEGFALVFADGTTAPPAHEAAAPSTRPEAPPPPPSCVGGAPAQLEPPPALPLAGGGGGGGGGTAAAAPPARSFGEASPRLLRALGGPAGAPLLEALTALRRVARVHEEEDMLLAAVEGSGVLSALAAAFSALGPGACGTECGGVGGRMAVDELLVAAVRVVDAVAGAGERLSAAVEFAGVVPLLVCALRGALCRGGYAVEPGAAGEEAPPPERPADPASLPLPTAALIYHVVSTMSTMAASPSAARALIAAGALPLLGASLRVRAPPARAGASDTEGLGSLSGATEAVRMRAAEALWWIATEGSRAAAACVRAGVHAPLAARLAACAAAAAAEGEDAEVLDESETATLAGAVFAIAEGSEDAAAAVAATGVTAPLLATLALAARSDRSRCVMESVARALGAIAATSSERAAAIAGDAGTIEALLRILHTCADPGAWEGSTTDGDDDGDDDDDDDDDDGGSANTEERREYAERACGGAAAALGALFHAGGAQVRARILAGAAGVYDPRPPAVVALVSALAAHGESAEAEDIRGALLRMGYRETGEKMPVVVLEHLGAADAAARAASCLECWLSAPRRACARAAGPPPCRAPHECAICQDVEGSEDDSGRWLALRACGHLFHERCIMKWAVKQLRDEGVVQCPVDRRVASKDSAAGGVAGDTETVIPLEGLPDTPLPTPDATPAAGGGGGGGGGGGSGDAPK